MTHRFEWEPDLSRGEWLRPLEAEPFGSTLSIVPRGLEAYARLFHPVERDRPRATTTWQGIDEATYFDGVADIDAAKETERATWAQVAEAFSTNMHPEAQYARLAGRDSLDFEATGSMIAPDGWRYEAPSEGSLDATSLATASAVLARHTTTPSAGIAAIWEGWGGLVSSAGVSYFAFPSSLRSRFAAAARRWISVRYRGPYLARREPAPGTGLLAREVAVGPRLELHSDTGRSYIMFGAGADDFADAAWPEQAPWVDRARWAQSPSILWPDDHSWVLATEIDYDSTLIAGTSALISELSQTPGIEVLPIHLDADLTRQGDTVNQPN